MGPKKDWGWRCSWTSALSTGRDGSERGTRCPAFGPRSRCLPRSAPETPGGKHAIRRSIVLRPSAAVLTVATLTQVMKPHAVGLDWCTLRIQYASWRQSVGQARPFGGCDLEGASARLAGPRGPNTGDDSWRRRWKECSGAGRRKSITQPVTTARRECALT